MSVTRAAIAGYGNLGVSVARAVAAQADMALVAVYSRRATSPTTVPSPANAPSLAVVPTPLYPLADIAAHADGIDILFLCLGSATDIPTLAPGLAATCNTVDTYDNHGDMARHREAMDRAARAGGHVAVIAAGWDPGLFSLNRVLQQAILQGEPHTFWGPGVSQGHSDALRRIVGVRQAVQYTLPNAAAVTAAQHGEADAGAAHLRQCWVVADEQDHERIEQEIRTMPGYFAGYQVEVNFITAAEFAQDHTGMPHGGRVITSGTLQGPAGEYRHAMEFALTSGRNPDFTAAVQVAYGRAAHRLAAAGHTGAITPLEVAPHLLSPTPLDELIARYL